MRKIVAGLFISLDGVVESPEEWAFAYLNKARGHSLREIAATLGVGYGTVRARLLASSKL